MPLSASASPRHAALLKEHLCENARVIAIGVSRYDNFPEQPVTSATANALAWVVQALRMGVSPVGNPLAVEEAEDPEALVEQLQDILELSDLTPQETRGLQTIVEALRDHEGGWMKWRVTRPTLHNLLWDLVFVGNHLEYTQTVRTLVTFSGHGALSRGQLVLCAADTEAVSAAPSASALQARFDALLREVDDKRARYGGHLQEVKGDLERRVREGDAGARGHLGYVKQQLMNPYMVNDDPGADTVWRRIQDVMRACWRVAERKGLSAEYLDVQAVTAAALTAPHDPEVMLQVMSFHRRNLRRIPAPGARPAPSFDKVLTPYHFLLAFGRHDARCTLVLDACHSGGPGESLQGSLAGHDWLQAGVKARILSASQSAQLAAEARVGVQRFSVATWALTRVLSRWSPVEERLRNQQSGYAMGIRNGELVHRANMLLHALSFNQHISLHAPPPRPSAPSAADFPFFGLGRNTRTSTEPQVDAGGIQLESDTNSLTGWVIKVGPNVKAVLVAVGPQAAPWTYNGVQFKKGRLTVLFTDASAGDIAGASSFTMRKYARVGGGPVPLPLRDAVDDFSAADAMDMPEVNDSLEVKLTSSETASNVFSYTKPGGSSTVYLSWQAPANGKPGEMGFWKTGAFPYSPSDFDDAGVMTFTRQASRSFAAGDWKRPIHHGQTYPWP